MLIFKYIPNILKDEGRITKELPFVTTKTLQDYLNETGYELKDTKIIVTGVVIKDLTIMLKDGDEIIITPNIAPPVIGFIWGAIVLLAKTAWAFAILHPYIFWGMFLSLSYSIYSAFAGQRRPNFGGLGNGLDESSPTYGWDGIRNTQDVGTPIGIIYGEHRVGGNIINQYIRTDGDKEYLNLLIALSEGEIDDIDSVEINENPSINFDDIVLTKRYGTNSQTQITNFNDSHDLKTLSANLTKNNAYVYTTVNLDVTCFELKLTLISGLYQAGGSGNVESWDVTYKVEYKVHTDPNYIDLGSTTISGKSRTDLRRIFRKEGLTAGQYDIRITKTSDNSSLGPVKQGDLYLRGVDEIAQDEPLIYPNVALIGVEALATDQLSGGTPTITSLVKGRKVRIPDIRVAEAGSAVVWDDYYYDNGSAVYKDFDTGSALYWDGSTFVNAFSANPIWCLRDLLSNTRYGLGDYITTSQLDDTQLLEMAQYCEERVSDGSGGYEKRFRLDVIIDSSTKAIDLLTQLSATFRCFIFYSGGAIKLKIDKSDTPVQMFGMGNIISESFVQSWKSIKEIPNVIEVQFMNKDLNYKQEVISIMDEISIANGDPIRKKSLRLFCTRIGQALREGKYALNIAKCIQRTVTLKAGIDAIACQAGDLINISHDVPQWGFSGRVQANSTTTLVKLDQSITIQNAVTYKIRIRFADDTQEERYVSDGVGTYTEINVSVAFTQAPASYDLYSFGEENKVIAPYRIVSMKRVENSEVEITALEYDTDVYDTDTIALPDNNYSVLSLTIPDVENLTLTERLVKMTDGTIENCIDVWWTRPIYNTIQVITWDRAKIYLSDNNGYSWTYMGESYGEHFAIIGNLVDLKTYKVAVVSVGYNGKINALANSPTASIQLIGKSAPPSNVTTFLVNQSRDRLYFGWSAVTDVDLAGYEIRYGGTWDTAPAIASGISNNNFITLDFRIGNTQSFWIKAIDTSGNYSTTAKEAIVTIDNIPFTNIIESYSEQTAWAGTKSNTSKVGNNLEIDATFLTGTYTTPVRDIGYVATFKIGINSIVTVAGDDTWQDFGEQTFLDIPDTLRFNGSEIAGAASYEIRISEDNITWSAYQTWQAGDYKCRYFQIRMTLTRVSTSQDLECSEFNYCGDLPDVLENQDCEVTVANDGCDVVFTKTYHEAPAINITILTGDAFVWKQTGLSITGVNIKLYKLDGTIVTGTFRINTRGI